MLVVGRLNEAAVKAVSRVVRTDLRLTDDHVVEPRALDEHGLLVLGFAAGGPTIGGFEVLEG